MMAVAPGRKPHAQPETAGFHCPAWRRGSGLAAREAHVCSARSLTDQISPEAWAFGGAAAWPLKARGQSTTIARVGFLRQAGPDDKHFAAFRGGLLAAGYSEGRNVVIEQRYAAGAYDRLHELALELVRLR